MFSQPSNQPLGRAATNDNSHHFAFAFIPSQCDYMLARPTYIIRSSLRGYIFDYEQTVLPDELLDSNSRISSAEEQDYRLIRRQFIAQGSKSKRLRKRATAHSIYVSTLFEEGMPINEPISLREIFKMNERANNAAAANRNITGRGIGASGPSISSLVVEIDDEPWKLFSPKGPGARKEYLESVEKRLGLVGLLGRDGAAPAAKAKGKGKMMSDEAPREEEGRRTGFSSALHPIPIRVRGPKYKQHCVNLYLDGLDITISDSDSDFDSDSDSDGSFQLVMRREANIQNSKMAAKGNQQEAGPSSSKHSADHDLGFTTKYALGGASAKEHVTSLLPQEKGQQQTAGQKSYQDKYEQDRASFIKELKEAFATDFEPPVQPQEEKVRPSLVRSEEAIDFRASASRHREGPAEENERGGHFPAESHARVSRSKSHSRRGGDERSSEGLQRSLSLPGNSDRRVGGSFRNEESNVRGRAPDHEERLGRRLRDDNVESRQVRSSSSTSSLIVHPSSSPVRRPRRGRRGRRQSRERSLVPALYAGSSSLVPSPSAPVLPQFTLADAEHPETREVFKTSHSSPYETHSWPQRLEDVTKPLERKDSLVSDEKETNLHNKCNSRLEEVARQAADEAMERLRHSRKMDSRESSVSMTTPFNSPARYSMTFGDAALLGSKHHSRRLDPTFTNTERQSRFLTCLGDPNPKPATVLGYPLSPGTEVLSRRLSANPGIGRTYEILRASLDNTADEARHPQANQRWFERRFSLPESNMGTTALSAAPEPVLQHSSRVRAYKYNTSGTVAPPTSPVDEPVQEKTKKRVHFE